MSDVQTKSGRSLIFLAVFAFLVLVQLPFLTADADDGLGWSRGPFTDEGLYTAQARNALLTGKLDLAESDGVIKNPLFALFAWLALGTFGDSMLVMRLACVLLWAGVLALAAAGKSQFAVLVRWSLPLVFLSYFPLQYGHLALAEMICVSLIVAMLLFVHARLAGAGRWTIIASAVMGFLAYAFKVQFLYVAAIPTVAFVLFVFLEMLSGNRPSRAAWADIILSAVTAVAFFGLFVLLWILPNRDLFVYIVQTQAALRAAPISGVPLQVVKNIVKFILDPGIWPTALLLLITMAVTWKGVRHSLAGAADALRQFPPVVPIAAWLAVESHKLAISYLPSRYFLSLVVAAGLFAVSLLFAVAQANGRVVRLRTIVAHQSLRPDKRVLVALGLVIVLNAFQYVETVVSRQYAIRGAQEELARVGNWDGKVVVGAWAASIFWGTRAVTKPIWADYLNDKNIIASFRPTAIVTEPSQADSGGALSRDNVILPAKPNYTYMIDQWSVQVFLLEARR